MGKVARITRQASACTTPLIGFILLSIAARSQTFRNPVLGYDEQFYLLMGDRMLHGALPYVDLFDRKPLGLFLIFAAIRELGGDGFIQYKIVASLFAAMTGFLIYRVARPLSNGFAAGAAGALYILWLNLMEGEGGQAQVFYNLPVLMAAILSWRALDERKNILMLGSGAMILSGLALQIKYTALFEGCFFGATLLWAQWQAERNLPKLALAAGTWSALALLPTASAVAYYGWRGELQPYVFANFLSNFGRPPLPQSAEFLGLIEIIALLLPLGLLTLPTIRDMQMRFVAVWTMVAFGGMLAFGSFVSSQYGLNIIVPLCIAAAPLLAHRKYGRTLAVAFVAIALIAGQLVVHRVEDRRGDAKVVAFLTAYAQPKRGCLYVYSGFPALYMLTHSCLPTRWAFPNHLNAMNEASAGAIGVDPAREERRILAAGPETIVDYHPVSDQGNPATRAILDEVLLASYHLVAQAQVGPQSYRLVYRRN